MQSEQYRLGIDFGTTYSCVATWKDGGIIVIPNSIGERTSPSVVIFESPTKFYVGEETLNHLSNDVSVKIYEIKRLIGKSYDQIKDIISYFPFKIIKEKNGNNPMIQMTFENNQKLELYPEQIVTLILRKLIKNANSFLNRTIREVLITVPADFSELQKKAVKNAVEVIDDIRLLKVINEPTAAILAYGFPKNQLKNILFPFNKYFTKKSPKIAHPMEETTLSTNSDQTQSNSEYNNDNENLFRSTFKIQNKELTRILVVDLGGGTYDVTIVEIENSLNFESKASAGNQRLGGSDFDKKLMDYCITQFINKNYAYLDQNKIKNNYKCMQRLKRACEETKKFLSIKSEDIIAIENFYDKKNLVCKITRAKFEDLCKDLFDKLTIPLDKVLQEANIKNENIDEIIFVGGSCLIPKVKEIIQSKFPNVPINDKISPDEAVAFGAAICAESPRRTEGEFWENFSFRDKTQHSYGIETADGKMEVIIQKGIKYPITKKKYFHNEYNNQLTFDLKILEGENKLAKDNEIIGEFTLEGFPQLPAGQVILEVTIGIDSNQILTIKAFTGEGNQSKEIKITKNNQLPQLENNKIKFELNEPSKLNKEEKDLLIIINDYTREFINQKSYKDKHELIKKYNSAIIKYLKFLEDNTKDTSSEKYLFLTEKLFVSYTYFFITDLATLIDLNEKAEIKNNIKLYLKKINNKAPFRLKQLLVHFKNIKTENFLEKLEIFVYTMDLLHSKADEYYNNKEESYLQLAKVIYEECLQIEKFYIEKADLIKMDVDLLQQFKNLKKDCEEKIKVISAMSLVEIDKLKKEGKLFNNENKLDDENLSLLSYNLELAVKKIDEIENLSENKNALETKSFYLANIVKIAFLKHYRNVNLKVLEANATESISIAEKLKNCKNKPWFKEIVQLKKEIMEMMKPKPDKNINEIRSKLSQAFYKGNENLIRHLLKYHPYDENMQTSSNIINEYESNKKKFLLKMRRQYENKNDNEYFSDKNESSPLKDAILEYVDRMIDNI